VSRIAKRVGITLKTAVRRHSALIDDHAVFFAADLDWARHPSVLAYLFFQGHHAREDISRELGVRFPRHLLMNREGVGFMGTKYESPHFLVVRLPVESPSAVQSLAVGLSKLKGVTEVRTEVWGPSRRYPRWFAERLAERVRASHQLCSPRRGSGAPVRVAR
jgi:hypothetical protein